MVEEKKKRGRPKKIKEVVTAGVTEKKEMITAFLRDDKHRRDDLCIQMIMGTIAKQGTIKYDHAKDIFNTATQLAYDFQWMAEPKAKKQLNIGGPQLDEFADVIVDHKEGNQLQEALANTPAAIFRALREGT
jgi:hypothetical protein